MLQRIQTVFMFLALLTTGFYAYLGFQMTLVPDCKLYMVGGSVASVLVLINIFMYANRSLQIKLNIVAILLLIILLGLSIYQNGFLSGEKQFSEKDIRLFIPFISIVLLLIANKYIKRDERLVKSVDRIR